MLSKSAPKIAACPSCGHPPHRPGCLVMVGQVTEVQTSHGAGTMFESWHCNCKADSLGERRPDA